jgi:glutaminase
MHSIKLFDHIGREPSGHSFNAITLDQRKRPYNPMINAGAIISCSLLKHGASAAERFDYIDPRLRKNATKLDVVKYFLARSADTKPVDRWGGTPLEDAHRHGHRDIVTMLTEHMN